MATIVTKNSSTASAVPTTSDLVQGELAVNVTDKRIFTENASTQIVELGTNPSTVTTTTATVSGTLTANGTFASSNAVVTGGSINSTPIGAVTPSTVRGSTVTATTGFVGGLTGNVVGNVTGNVTGNVVGNVTGDLTGNVTASSGTSTVNNLVVNGTVDFSNTRLTDVAEPIAGSDAATKTYVDTSIAAVIDGAPAALDTLNELAAALNDDASFHTTVTNALTGKLALSGGTMTGQLSLGANKIVSVADPTLAQDVATKAYVDAADTTGLPLAGGTMSGAIAMGTNKITGMGDPTAAQDAATKAYTDSILGSATSAATSASAAATSASNASTSASGAATSATNAGNSETAAASSAAAAATTYDNFDDRYLGDKSSDPTVDNDGNALLTGALYFNTTSDAMKVYTGSAWAAVAPTATSVTVSQISDYNGTAAELNYTDGVTSPIQTQLNTKAPLASPTFTGTVTATAFSGDGSALTGVDSLPSQTNNAGKFLTTDGTDPSWAEVSASPTLDAVASGALSNGDTVAINADGTVSVVQESSEATGSTTNFNTGNTDYIDSAYDSNSNKIVLIYRDGAGSSHGKAVVGTVSGTSISFGGETTFIATNSTMHKITFDSNSNKVVIAFRDGSNSNYGTAIVGTVSGTSISFGSKVVFVTKNALRLGITFDSNSNKVLIAYRDQTTSQYGRSVVGTVSGTSISFGSVVTFEEADVATTEFGIDVAFDSSNNKVVVAWNGNSVGKAVVGTISGTSITYGTAATFNAAYTDNINATFDSNVNKVIIAYTNGSSTAIGTAIACSVVGTSLSLGAPIVFETSNINQLGISFNADANKFIISYKDEGDTDNGKVISGTADITNSITFDADSTFETGEASSNTNVFDSSNNKTVLAYYNGSNAVGRTYSPLSSNNNKYIGISDGAYSDSETAKVQIVGSVDDAQTSLVAGAKYYVKSDGTLSASSVDSSIYAGIAVSSTKLIIKG